MLDIDVRRVAHLSFFQSKVCGTPHEQDVEDFALQEILVAGVCGDPHEWDAQDFALQGILVPKVCGTLHERDAQDSCRPARPQSLECAFRGSTITEKLWEEISCPPKVLL
jgi:hypothetical protein